ncbi:hypothetical protein NLI96_g2435 [Meripilus lineatus]|uniref:Vacuolar calcium ion transporter n=1 Tax=Meripilus lineatus TaxID=2056292 RepID=A0AAD5V8A9_9APHY|nr:hypothetical protein NLI96_g2435 [Physisporinus lineatus]
MSRPAERSPLLGNPRRRSCGNRFLSLFRQESEPSWTQSIEILFSTHWVNVLLIFVPLSFVSHFTDVDVGLQFAISFLALIPLSALLGIATEQLSLEVGQTPSSLLNATFSNAVEIIVAFAALMRDEPRIVQTSLLGSILSNILSVLGFSFFFGGFKHKENKYDAEISSSLMTLTCITLVIPAAYHAAQSQGGEGTIPSFHSFNASVDVTLLRHSSEEGLQWISRGASILLLCVYAAFLFFQLKTHSYLYEKLRKHQDPNSRETAKMSSTVAALTLLGATALTGCCADFLISSIERTVLKYHISERFIGMIMIPIVGNAAEHVASVWMASKGKMELAVGICVGSAIQIASFVIPLLVIIGWITSHPLTLFFEDFEHSIHDTSQTVVLFVSVLLVNFLIQTGNSNYLQGLILITLYLVIVLTFWVS